MLKYLLLYPAEVLSLLVLLALIWGVRIKPALLGAVGLLAVVALIARTLAFPPEGYDLELFWQVGQTVLSGGNPYDDQRILHPPTAGPFYLFVGLVPFSTALTIVTVATLLGAVALVPLAAAALQDRGQDSSWRPSAGALMLLTGVVAFSHCSRRAVDAGQIPILTTVALVGALALQPRGRPILAGTCLALASLKAGTLVPFLLLFHRKRDLLSWVALIVVGVGLSLMTCPPQELPARCWQGLRNIATLSGEGMVNDYIPANSQSADLIGLDHAAYHLGLRDRITVKIVSLTVLGLLGAWIAWQVLRPGGWSRPAACSLVAFYAAIFLYHRQYDMVILVLPLVYATGQALATGGPTRAAYALCVMAVVGVLYLHLPTLFRLREEMEHGNATLWVEAVVAPYGTWLVLTGLAFLVVGERFRGRADLDVRDRAANDWSPSS